MNHANGWLRPGIVLGGRYRLAAPVGAGGMAFVWQADDEVLDRVVAVKILGPQQVADPDCRLRIRQEARVLAAFSHPHIAHVHDYGEADDELASPYIVMELVKGRNLLRRLNEGPIPPPSALRIATEIAGALAAAHGQGLVHRDMKPANVMLSPDGVKVVDFGIAAATAPPGASTAESVLLGTPSYLSPERLLSDAVEPASDVYALGVILYRMLANRSPWTADETTQILNAHLYVDPSPIPEIPGVPHYVLDLCHRLIRKDPSMRPSAKEAAGLLARAARSMEATGQETAPVVQRNGSVSRWVLGVGAVATALASALILLPDATTSSRAGRPDTGASAAARVSRSADPRPASSPLPSRQDDVMAGAGATPPIPPKTATTSAKPVLPPPTRTSAKAPASAQAPRSAPVPDPDPTSEPPSVTRTLTSEAGSLLADCPSPSIAKILSWTAIEPFKVHAVDAAPGTAPSISFKYKKQRVKMTVTCHAGVPAVEIS